MNLLRVDEETCIKCGICSKVCTIGIINQSREGYPLPVPDADALCNRCGACVAACPVGSIDITNLPLIDSPLVNPKLKISLQQCSQLIKSRRSIRVYKNKQVPHGLISQLIEVARYAPTGGNTQNVKWLIVDEKDKMQRLRKIGADFVLEAVKNIPAYAPRLDSFKKRREAGFDIFMHGAPAILCTYSDQNMPITSIDSIIALAYFDLAAHSAGLGCCWLGFFMAAVNNSPEMKDILSMPKERQITGSMIFGYPAYNYPRIPVRNQADIKWLS